MGITFHDTVPETADWLDAPMTEPTEDGRARRVSASCVFWAQHATFTTAPEDHGNWSAGRLTLGLVEAEGILDKTDVGTLLEVGWVTMEAFAGAAALDRSPVCRADGAVIGYALGNKTRI